jgi:hypothetical protein
MLLRMEPDCMSGETADSMKVKPSNPIWRMFLPLLVLLGAVLASSLWKSRSAGAWVAVTKAQSGGKDQAAKNQAPHRAVLVELFTSEGCSSCPPADELLRHLRQDLAGQGIDVIPLGFHVDYWNSLGWKDRFSSADFSRRQEQYARSLGVDGPYTPQMIVDGKVEFVGNNGDEAQRAITEAASGPAQAEIAISLEPADRVSVRMKLPPGSGTVSVALAVTEDNLATRIGAGENNGRELRHAAVVREFKILGQSSGEAYKTEVPLAIAKEWKREDLRAVAFVQQGDSGKVLGAASVPLRAQPR